MNRYDAQTIEAKWQRVWEETRAFEVPNPEPGAPRNERKSYVLEMLPYPSGSLHIGHVLVYTLGDVLAHFYRRTGSEVLRPMGYDSFGLPAENAAIKEGEHPRKIVERNIERIRAQMKRMGWAIDWSREFSTHEPEYYRWTQWLFLKFLETGHAYRKAAIVNWCPNDQTVLANEQVKDGRCERCGAEVEARKLDEWYVRKAGARPIKERAAGTDKTGVFTGFFATNPVNDARIPIWIADYVLMDYGTGAIMAVPAHDERDGEFAERFDLPMKVVIDEEGTLVDSAQFSSLPHEEAAKAIVDWLGTHGRD